MIIKVLWALTGFNVLVLLAGIYRYSVYNHGRSTDGFERTFMNAVAIVMVIITMVSAGLLKFGNSAFTTSAAAFFALLPLLIVLGRVVQTHWPEKKAPFRTMAETYYSEKSQVTIATAIEQGDIPQLKELISNEDLSIKGTRVWDQEGLNYLQFAIRLKSNLTNLAFDDVRNAEAIKLLVESGSPATAALPEAIRCLPIHLIEFLLDAGADPNCIGFSAQPVIFDVMGNDSLHTAIAGLLYAKGADLNAKGNYGYTPVMWAAQNAGTSENKIAAWQQVRWLLETVKVDTSWTTKNGKNLKSIMISIVQEARETKIEMCSDFQRVNKFLALTD